MREIRTSGSEGGVVSSITIPTPIKWRLGGMNFFEGFSFGWRYGGDAYEKGKYVDAFIRWGGTDGVGFFSGSG